MKTLIKKLKTLHIFTVKENKRMNVHSEFESNESQYGDCILMLKIKELLKVIII